MITLKNFKLSRLLSQQVAPVCLGRELQGSNVFLVFFGCVSRANYELDGLEKLQRYRRLTRLHTTYSSIITGVL
jgi:hypothetical protein